MTFNEWWQSYKLPVISSRGHFDILMKATRAAYNAGRKAAREELNERKSAWQMKQRSLSESSGVRRSTGG